MPISQLLSHATTFQLLLHSYLVEGNRIHPHFKSLSPRKNFAPRRGGLHLKQKTPRVLIYFLRHHIQHIRQRIVDAKQHHNILTYQPQK